MKNKFIILKCNLLKEEEQEKFDFLSEYGVDYEYVKEYVDDDDTFIERQLRMEANGPDTFSYTEEYIQKLKSANVIITFYSPIPSEVLKSENLQAVLVLRSGVENVNLEQASQYGVKVMNTPGRLTVPVAEFTVGLIIAEMKNIARSHQKLMAGKWEETYPNSSFLYNLKNKNIGIVGCGAIGSYVAEIMKAMHGNILVYDPFLSEEIAKEKGYTQVSLEELCKKSDVISIHYRLTKDTENLINEKHFDLMKPTAYFINTARAGLVDEEALIHALEEKKIAGAALDVFHQEPLAQDNPLLKMDNVTLTSHLAGTCTDLMELTLDIAYTCIRKFLETGEWSNVVNQ